MPSRSEPGIPVPVVARLGAGGCRHAGAPRPALFLDRDGVIIADTGYISWVADVRLLPGVARAIARANAAGIPVVVVSNQSGVGRGRFGWPTVDEIDDAMGLGLARDDARIDLALYCGVSPDDRRPEAVGYRKPGPGMLTMAARMLPIRLGGSVVVGDRPGDLQAGARAGLAAGVIVAPGPGNADALSALAAECPPFEILQAATPEAAVTMAVERIGAGDG